MSSTNMILPSWNEVDSRASAASSQQPGSRRSNEPDNFARTENRPQHQNPPKKPFGHYAQERANDSQSSIPVGSTDGRRGGFVDRDSVFDEFKYKELCLNAASRTKMTTTYLTKIRDHIVKEASLEWEVAASYDSFMDENENVHNRYGRSYISSAPAPKEAMILENSSSELQAAASLCIKAVSECLHSRKTIYLTQLKKIRETSNMATRNAVQHERSEAGAYLNRLKESLEAQRRQEVRACEDRVVELQNTISSLRATLETAQGEIARLGELETNRVGLQNTAVAEALQRSRDEHASDRARLQADWAAERQRILEETQAQVAEMKRQTETQLEFQRQHEREMRELILQDKNRAEAETAKLRDEHITVVAKLTSEKDRGVARLQEERERAESDQQAALAEAVKGQATLRAELAAALQRVKNEEQKRATEQDAHLSKYREKLLTAHSLEIEKINERHRNEMKKYHAELQVRSQDAISKLKHTHEQELNRLIRDNERLQRIIVRHGGADQFRAAAAAPLMPGNAVDTSIDESVNASFFNAAQSPGMRFSTQSGQSSSKGLLSKSPLYSRRVGDALTPPGKFRPRVGRSPEGGVAGVASAGATMSSLGGGGGGGGATKRSVNFGTGGNNGTQGGEDAYDRGRGEEAGGAVQRVPDSPPPPPRTSAASVLQWGELARSLQQQEDQDRAYSHLPPDPFAVQESLSNSRAARNNNGSSSKLSTIGVEENSRRVGDYTRELDRYLVSKGNDSGKSSAVPMSVVKELPTLGSVLETSSHSSLNFNAQMAHHYQKSKERLGIAPPKSPAYDSDSDADGENAIKMAEEVDYEEDVDMSENLKVSVGGDSKGRKVTAVKSKGRGHDKNDGDEDRYNGRGGVFENIQRGGGSGPLQSIEGWILFVTNVHQEAQEDDILDKFSEYGTVKNIHVNLDRRTGFVKGYALVEFEEYNDALSAIKGLNGKKLLDQVIKVDWAFTKK